MTRRVLQPPSGPEAQNKSSTTASPSVITVTLTLRQQPCHHAPSTENKTKDAVNEPTSRTEMIPLMGIDRTGPGLHHQGPLAEERQTDCKQDYTKAFTDFAPPPPTATRPTTQRALAKPPAGMKRWDSVERTNGRRRHTVLIE
ncbi:MAG: hypothetical protein Q9224_002431 [Gallowayella concinna]